MYSDEMTPPKGLSDKDMAPYGWAPKPCSFCNGLGTESNGGICGVCDGTKLLDHPVSAEKHIDNLRDQLEASQQRERELQAKYDDLSALLTIYRDQINAIDEARVGANARVFALTNNPARRALADTPAQEGNR